MAVRSTGLQQTQPTGGKRAASVVREDVSWQCVEITDEEDPKNPRWRCRGCLNFYSGGATKVTDHLLGRNRSAKCTGTDAAFLALVDKVKVNESKKEQKKNHKQAVVAVNCAAAVSSSALVVSHDKKQPLLNFSLAHAEGCDAAIAEFFYACNIPAAVVDHPKFSKLVATLKAAPP
eukprot:6532030-Prymnesium_polylepis.1